MFLGPSLCHSQLMLLSSHLLLPLKCCPPFPRTLVMTSLGPSGYSPHLRILNLYTSAHLQSPFCHSCSHSQVLGITKWTSLLGEGVSLFSTPWSFPNETQVYYDHCYLSLFTYLITPSSKHPFFPLSKFYLFSLKCTVKSIDQ